MPHSMASHLGVRIAHLVLLIAGFGLLAASGAFAQSLTDDAVKSLSPASQDAIHQLATLSELPAAQWRFHRGDVAHGEAPDLDDSSWTLVERGSGDDIDAVWYRRMIEVPKTLNGYDLTGSRIWFQFNAYANGPMPEIIYYNGRRVALGEDLEPIVLFDRAQPGDKILVAVKLLHTVDKKRFAGAELHIDFNPSRPNPATVLNEILSIAEIVHESVERTWIVGQPLNESAPPAHP